MNGRKKRDCSHEHHDELQPQHFSASEKRLTSENFAFTHLQNEQLNLKVLKYLGLAHKSEEEYFTH